MMIEREIDFFSSFNCSDHTDVLQQQIKFDQNIGFIIHLQRDNRVPVFDYSWFIRK